MSRIRWCKFNSPNVISS